MGKQLEFYMTPVDEEQFVTAMKASGDVVVAPAYFPSPELVELDAATVKQSVYRDGYAILCLVNKGLDPKVIIEPAGPERFCIRRSESEVIEFGRWTIVPNDGKKEPGRLWYDNEDMNCKPKRKAFLSWAQSVFRYIKKHYHRSEEHYGRYFGPDAWEKFQSGEMILAPY